MLRVAKGVLVFGHAAGHWKVFVVVLGVLAAMAGYRWLSKRAE